MKPDTCEAGLSNHYKMVYSFLRKTFAKGKPKSIYYQCFKNFEHKKFNEEFKKEFQLIYLLKRFLKSFNLLWRDSLLINTKKYGITTILS